MYFACVAHIALKTMIDHQLEMRDWMMDARFLRAYTEVSRRMTLV